MGILRENQRENSEFSTKKWNLDVISWEFPVNS